MHKNPKPQTFLAVSFLAIALSYGSYTFGVKQAMTKVPQPAPAVKVSRIGPESIVKSQQALAVGVVVGKTDNSITVKGDDSKTSSFPLSPSVTVATIATGSAASKPEGKTAIVLNKKALVSLDLRGSDYEVTNITYIPK